MSETIELTQDEVAAFVVIVAQIGVEQPERIDHTSAGVKELVLKCQLAVDLMKFEQEGLGSL